MLKGEALCAEYLEEDFQILSGWDDYTGDYYGLDNAYGSAHMYEMGDPGVDPFISRTVEMPGWEGFVFVELDYRAKSSCSQTNAYFDLYDESENLSTICLYVGGLADTGWKHGRWNITGCMVGHWSVEIRLRIHDIDGNRSQEAWFDNVTVYALQSGLYLDEDFASLFSWADHTGPVYDVNISGGAARLHEIGTGFASPYVSRSVNVTGWGGSIYLGLDFRATSQYAGATDARVDIYDPTSNPPQPLGTLQLVAGDTLDSGWDYRDTNITSWLINPDRKTKIEVRPKVYDLYAVNWSVEAFFDNIKVWDSTYWVGPEGYYLFEVFDDLDDWSDNTGTSYDVDINCGAAHIYEIDGYCVGPYISRSVYIQGWGGTMYLELDYRAKSHYWGPGVTNAYVDFYNGTQNLGTITLASGNTYDTGWQHRKENVTEMFANQSTIEIRLRVQDAWMYDWEQQAWFDNVTLWDYPIPPNPELGLYYGYFQVFDMNMSTVYPVPNNASWHMANARNQSNTIVIPDRVFVNNSELYCPDYADKAYQYGFRNIIFDMHGTFAYFWFDEENEEMTREARMDESRKQCQNWSNRLSSNNIIVRALYLFDEPLRGPNNFSGDPYGPDDLRDMRDVVLGIPGWQHKPTIITFYRLGNKAAQAFGWWDHTVGTGYQVKLDNGKANISGDGYVVYPYISHYVDVGGWQGNITLELDYRAKSDYWGPSEVTNAYVLFYDGPTHLGTVSLAQKYKKDTGPKHKKVDVTSMLQGHSYIEIRLQVSDAWSSDYHQSAHFDNVTLYSGQREEVGLDEGFHYSNLQYMWDYDTRAATLVPYCNWTAVDPYFNPRNTGPGERPISIVREDMFWAKQTGHPAVLIGQAFDPPFNQSIFDPTTWFQTSNNQSGSFITPNASVIGHYYWVATDYGAKALLWWWYPSSYASSYQFHSIHSDPDHCVLPVNDMWCAQWAIWIGDPPSRREDWG